MTLLQITEVNNALIDYGVLGIIVVIMMAAIVYLQTRINKKDEQILNVTNKSIEAFGAMSSLISVISEATKEMPEKVRDKMKDDINMLKETINSIKL